MTAPRTRSGSRKDPGAESLLAAIFANRPDLPEAKCRTHWDPFDSIADGKATDDDKRYARELCSRCPHLTECPDAITAPNERQLHEEVPAHRRGRETIRFRTRGSTR